MSKAKSTMIRIQQVKSTIGCTDKQKETLRGLGLRRISHVVERQDTPATRGSARKIPHLVKILEEEGA
jgi:large subunit ribosomal protein L30